MLISLLHSMRPRQWVKNLIIYAGLVFDRQLSLEHLGDIGRTTLAFIIFCLLSGVVYIINDIADAESDRNHPQKHLRPIASGELSITTARSMAIIILATILPFAFWLGPSFMGISLLYLGLNLGYSFGIKHVPLLDALAIAFGFVLRVAAGVVIIQVTRFSPWLYIVVSLGSLYMAFGKRRAELALLADKATMHRRVLDGYTLALLDQLIIIVSSTTIISYSLYTFSAPNLPDNHITMLTIPFVIYGVFRYLYLIQVKHQGGAPEEVLLSDRPLKITILIWGISILAIFYAF